MGLQELKKREKVRKQVLTFGTFVLLLGVSVGVCAGTYSGGTGEPNDPYRIATANDLNDIGNHVEDFNKCFVMVNDINMADYTGTQFNIIGTFSDWFRGVFDGNGHTISNFTYQTALQISGGIFREVSGPNAVIQNVRLIDPNINAPAGGGGSLVGRLSEGTVRDCHVENATVSAAGYVGGLIGTIKAQGLVYKCTGTTTVVGEEGIGGLVGSNSGIVRGCHCTSNVTGGGAAWDDGYMCGGLVGKNYGRIVNCSVSATTVSGNHYVGGAVGLNGGFIEKVIASVDVRALDGFLNKIVGGFVGRNGGEVLQCRASGTVKGENRVGGLVGDTHGGNISECYANAAVTGGYNAGGLVGYHDGGSYRKCFWDSDINPDMNGMGNGSNPNVMGKTTAEMMTESTFTDAGWDFVEVWGIGEGQTYPFLRVYPAGDLNHDGIVDFRDVAILAGHWLEEE
jgi:hypothetical protein